ncbi:MAG TPA: serine hydrolase domain-containing protein [Streptosporangiaceae bacterium]|nr:serine hydrolase domain-containing protein [Streptosporangiaceae bacterium]
MPGAVEGHCDPRFAPLRDAFRANFAERGEVGAAVCVMVNNNVVADLYGGWADREQGRPWQQDTLVNMFSVGKGLVAACTARLAGQGKLDLDATVASYWPEFAAANKDAITVRQLLSHQAGLPSVRRRLPPNSMLDWPAMTAALAETEPWWEPGTAHGYHVNTFGFLAGEVIRRITGSTAGALLRDEIAGPLGADVHIGLPASEHERVATFIWPGPPPAEEEPPGLDPAQLMEHNSYYNPGGLSGAGVINTPQWRSAECPSTNAHGTASGVARVYAALINPVNKAIVDPAALEEAITEQVYGQDLVLHRPSRFGLGFQLTQPERPIGPGQAAFGHFGAGGSLGFADPETGIAFGYVMNQMGPRWQNPRTRALVDAVYACL